MSPVVVFDLFGTLLDIATIRDDVAHLTPDADAFVATWREKQIGYAFAGTIMGRYEDFDGVTRAGLRYALAKHGVVVDDDRERELATAWERVRAYPDAVPLLDALRERGTVCAVLTNGTPTTARAAIAAAGVTGHLDAVLSVDQIGIYKPDRRVYELVTERFAVAPEAVVFVSSNGWDATGAAAFGFRVAWCNRFGAPAETVGPAPEWTIATLADVAQIAARVAMV